MSHVMKFVAFCACLAVGGQVAEADWADDFTGGLNQPWVFFDDAGNIPPDQTVVAASSGALALAGDPAGLTTGDFDRFAAGLVGLTDSNYLFTDVRLTGTVSTIPQATVVGGGPEQGNNDTFLLTRSNGASGYVLSIDFDSGDVDLVRSDNGVVSGLPGNSSASIAGFDPLAAYTMELTAVGDQLSGRVWHDGSLVAMVDASDATYVAGFAGVGTAINDNDGIGPGGSGRTLLAAVFDDVSAVTVPEPSCFALLVAGLLFWRRRR